MTFPEIEELISQISYKDWKFEVQLKSPVFVQDDRLETAAIFDVGCSVRVRFEADGERWYGRWWRLSTHMSPAEVAQTCLKAVLTAEEHEAREKFLYRGRAIYGPHLSLESLWERAADVEERVPA